MSKIWSSETPAILAALAALVLIGILTDNWLLASLLTSCTYIVWLYYRLHKLEKWIRRGTKASQVYDDNGFVGIIIRHLYQQKKIHNERKKRTKQILRRLNRNISALPDATILLNSNLEIEWSNEPAQYLLDIRDRHDQGQRIANLIRDPLFLDYLQAPEKQDYLEISAPANNQLTIQIKIVQFGDSQYLLSARNVSDHKQLKESLKHFVANASHELKSPLTVISGHLEMLEDEDGISKNGKRSLHTAQRQAQRMHELIQGLLLLSQVESYQLQPSEGDQIGVSEIMNQILTTLENEFGKTRLDCHIPQEFRLLGVKTEIEGICLNLIENALKYSPGELPVKVEWNENLLGEYTFSVSDQGPGIEATEIEKITQRYYRGPGVRETGIEGAGLGLAIVKQAVNKHGGILEIDSVPGRGSRFSVTFPSYRCIKQEPRLAPVLKLADY